MLCVITHIMCYVGSVVNMICDMKPYTSLSKPLTRDEEFDTLTLCVISRIMCYTGPVFIMITSFR